MKAEFAALMAQVIPVVLLARVLQVKDRLNQLLRAQNAINEDLVIETSKSDVAQKIVSNGVLNGAVIAMLVASEAICITAVAGPLPGRLAQKFVVVSTVLAVTMLGFDLIRDAVAIPLVAAVKQASNEAKWYGGMFLMGTIMVVIVGLSVYWAMRT